MTVRELLARVGSDELSEWMAYDRIHVPDSWHQTAQLCCLIANAWRSKGRPFTPDDFLPRRPGQRRRELLPAEGLKAAMGRARGRHNRAMGATRDGDQNRPDPRP